MKNDAAIVLRGAREHNLKGFDLTIPRDQLVVITGPSGSGKSSLAFDTIYAEGQRRYVESLSTYARQFIYQQPKPDIEEITGLSPTISIEQKTTVFNPRSTVGTITEIYDYLRLLYARVADPFCYQCGNPIESQTQQQIVDTLSSYSAGTKLALLAPIIRGRKGEHIQELIRLRQQGFVRVKIDGEVFDLGDDIRLDKQKHHDIEVYIDRIILKNEVKGEPSTQVTRISESVELALRLGSGAMIVETIGTSSPPLYFSEKFACRTCNISYAEPEPRTFSFNNKQGACETCEGTGFDTKKIERLLESVTEETIHIDYQDPALRCPTCQGQRLKKESLHYRIAQKNIIDISSLSIQAGSIFFKELKLPPRKFQIADRLIREIIERLDFLVAVGVPYLALNRRAMTLSGGELQRVRLATQIGSSLTGVVYILDEPSIGLHPGDHERLLGSLESLKSRGNTVLVVEHDRETMEKADYIIDLGPGAGRHGGELMAHGSLASLLKNPNSLTGLYLSNQKRIAIPAERRKGTEEHALVLTGAHENNLKNIEVRLPLSTFICITGVSGSGKSSLVFDTLYPILKSHLYSRSAPSKKNYAHIQGLERIDKVVDIDQSPIGRTPRSTPSTYCGIFSLVRDLFSALPEAQIRGYRPGRFSFNVKEGRCEHCDGAGYRTIEMHFLPDSYQKCEFCNGSRYSQETLQIYFKGKNIAEVLEMTIEEAFSFFENVPKIKNLLKTLVEVGLGYVQLGQAATTLSGGEAQRMKLARELQKRSTGKTLYLLDEPSTGLHFNDIQKLILILQQLVEQGNTVVVIEHNLDIVKVADHIIDMGPKGGEAGGEILFAGTPEALVKKMGSKAASTGYYLKKYLF